MNRNIEFLSMPKQMAENYKLSRYNLYNENKKTVFNTVTQATAEFDEHVLKMSDVEALIECGFIVEKGVDELELLKEEYLSREKFSNELHLIIATTLDCQFRCTYCYEDHPKIYMDKIVKQEIINLIHKYAESGKNISIVWYGGEPMLDFISIEEMTAEIKGICNRYGVSYEASMISNGQLFDDSSILKLDDLSIKSVQITLDGMKEFHEKRRPMIDNSESFERIISNIVNMDKNSNAQVHIRVNVDKDNINSAYELVDYLSALVLVDIDMNLGMMKEFGCEHSCGNCNSNLFTMKDFAEEFLEFRDYLECHGFYNAISKMQPEYKVNSCTMDAPDSYVIDPNGYVYKCISKVGQREQSIGNVKTGFLTDAHNTVSPFEFENCTKCRYFPICKGGCLMNNGGNRRECNIWKYITEELVSRTLN